MPRTPHIRRTGFTWPALLLAPVVACAGCGSPTVADAGATVQYRDGETITFEGNPLFWGADPSGHVWQDGTMWVYPTTDAHDWATLVHWNAWSSSDLRTWTFHERIFGADQCGWCVNNAWAPDIAYRDGRYYFYYYFRNDDVSPNGVGVAVSDSPAGPFTNVTTDAPLFDGTDPSVFVDDDGSAYIYTAHVIRRLEPDMVHLVQEDGRPLVHLVELRGRQPLGGWEGVWVFKREGRYYFTAADDDYRQLSYWVGSSPMGPFDFGGILLPKVSGLNVHHSIVEFQGRWILWVHLWPEDGPGQRRVYGEILDFNADGTIRPVVLTKEGVLRRTG